MALSFSVELGRVLILTSAYPRDACYVDIEYPLSVASSGSPSPEKLLSLACLLIMLV